MIGELKVDSNKLTQHLILTLLFMLAGTGCQPIPTKSTERELLFCANQAVYLAAIEPDGRAELRRVLDLPKDSTCPIWSHDGKLGLLYRIRRDGLVIRDSLSLIERYSGTVQEVYQFGPRDAEWLFRWLPDGFSMLMISARDYQGAEECRDSFGERSVNGTECWRNYADLYLTGGNLESGLAPWRRLTSLPAPRCELAWSTDGQKVAHTRGNCQEGLAPLPGAIDVLNLQTHELTVIEPGMTDEANSSMIYYDPQWSPDGEAILFTAWSMNKHRTQGCMADLESPQTHLAALGGVPVGYSPDGKKIIWRTDDTLGVTSLKGRETQEWPVSQKNVCLLSSQGWSPDSQRFAWTECRGDDKGLRVLNLETDQIITLTKLVPESLAWSADSYWLAFSDRVCTGHDTCMIDVYVVRADGASLHNVTSNQEMQSVQRGPAGWMGYRYYYAIGDVQWISP